MAEKRIELGNVGMTARGAWSADYSHTDVDGNNVQGYETGDTVTHSDNCLYESLVDANTVEPGTDETKWRLDVDGSGVKGATDSANTAAENANAKATLANTAATTANAAATTANNAASAAKEAQTSLQSDVTGLLAANGSYAYYAGLRQYGASSPTFSKEYGTREGLLATLDHFKLGTFKNGVLQHEFAPGRCDLATNGEDVPIDGTDGDVMIYTDTTIYRDRFTGTISDTEYNGMGLGLIPHLVGSYVAKEFKPFAITPDFTVNCKLDDDTVSQAHCIYNESVAGTYNAPTALFKQTVKANGNGYPRQYVSSLDSSEQARNKNTDTNSNSPYMGGYYEFWEIMWEAMYLELGTLDICAPENFGYGCTATAASATTFADTAMSGVSGVKIIESGGTEHYAALNGKSMQIGTDGSSVYNYAGICGTSYYGFLTCLEAIRILNNVTKNGLTASVGNSGAVFTDMGSTVVTDGSIDLSTGTGMTAGEKYMQIRNVPNCKGIADGVMTAVINIYIKLDIADGVYLAGGTTDLTGGTAIFKFSLPVYRGYTPLKGMFTQLEGAYYHQVFKDGANEEVNEFYSADSFKDVPVINTKTVYSDKNGTQNELKGMLLGLKYRFVTNRSGGWVQKAEYNASLFGYSALGGGQHTYECAYVWKDASWGFGGSSNGRISEGWSVVNASALGCNASYAFGGRFLRANLAAANRADFFAGAFAIPLAQLTA